MNTKLNLPTPSPEQQRAIDTMIHKIVYGAKVVSLSGDAGTGKTLTIHHLLNAIAEIGITDIVVVAFTNKAVKVLRSKGVKGPTTIHKRFYVIKEYVKPDGTEGKKFIPCDDKSLGQLPANKVKHARVTIVDEASMVHSKTLEDLGRMSDTLVLVGDGFQLPPPGDDMHPVGLFNEMRHTATLTTVHRQDNGGPILDIAQWLRQWKANRIDIWQPGLFSFLSPTFNLTQHVVNLEEQGVPWRFLAYHNDTCHEQNKMLREMFGRKGMFPQVGDRMIATANVTDELTNGTEIRIVDVPFMPTIDDIKRVFANDRELISKGMFGRPSAENRAHLNAMMDVVCPTVRFVIPDDGDDIVHEFPFDVAHHLKTYHPSEYERVKTMLAQIASSLGINPDDSAMFEYSYCMTVHKAQGSEFEQVFIVDKRRRNKSGISIRAREANKPADWHLESELMVRWFYTAITRAKHFVCVI